MGSCTGDCKCGKPCCRSDDFCENHMCLSCREPMRSPLSVFARGTTIDGRTANPEKIVGYACPECLLFFAANTFGADAARCAAQCCDRRCKDCNEKMPKNRYGWTRCSKCDSARAAERERDQFAKAKKVREADYSGWVYDGEDFYQSTEDFREHCEDEGFTVPEYVNACDRVELRLDAHSIIESATEEHHYGAYGECDVDGLQKLLDQWCASQGVASHVADTSTVVLLDSKEGEP